MPAADPIATDAVVIGAGPVGLFQVFQLGLQGITAHVIDALPHPGGQCVALYGDKPIYDIPGVPVCTGRELIALLQRQIAPFAPQWQLGALVSVLQPQADGRFLMETTRGTRLLARSAFIAAGVGAFAPRRIKLEGIERFAGNQLFYQGDTPAPDRSTGLQVVVHGGDEAAVAQAIALASRVQADAPDAPASVTLLHRRDAFQAPETQLAQLQQLRSAGRLQVVAGQITGLQVEGEREGQRLTALELLPPAGQPERLPLDQLQVFLGLSPRLGPIADWGLALERKQLRVDTATFCTSVPGIYAVGDINTYPGKRKLLVSGFHEATLAAWAAAEVLAGQTLPLQYTTTSPRLQRRLGVRAEE